MAKFKGVSYYDGGADLLRSRAATAGRVMLHLVSTYASGHSYATVISNSLGSVAITAGSIASTGAAGAARVDTFSYSSFVLTAGASGTPDLHFVVVDSVSSEVYYATDESTNIAAVVSGGTVTGGSFAVTHQQPT